MRWKSWSNQDVFFIELISKKYTSLCKFSICDLSEDITSYAPGELCLRNQAYNFHRPLRPF